MLLLAYVPYSLQLSVSLPFIHYGCLPIQFVRSFRLVDVNDVRLIAIARCIPSLAG